MGTLEQAIEVIRTAEERLQGLIAQAATMAEYDHLPRLTDWAKQLGSMAAGTRVVGAVDAVDGGVKEAPGHAPGPAPELSFPSSIKPSREQPLTTARPARPKRKGVRTRKKPGRSRTAGGEYPKFLREGQSLVKVGWSKKEKSTYEHKAPRQVVTALAQALVKIGRGGKRFSAEDLLPLNDPDGGGEVPSYQAYLALAWLRTEEVLTQHGRQGYSIPDGSDLSASIDQRWESLPNR